MATIVSLSGGCGVNSTPISSYDEDTPDIERIERIVVCVIPSSGAGIREGKIIELQREHWKEFLFLIQKGPRMRPAPPRAMPKTMEVTIHGADTIRSVGIYWFGANPAVVSWNGADFFYADNSSKGGHKDGASRVLTYVLACDAKNGR